MKEISLSEKYALTIVEACKYFGIGEHTLRRLIANNKKDTDWLLYIGNRTMIKRRKFEQYLDKTDAL